MFRRAIFHSYSDYWDYVPWWWLYFSHRLPVLWLVVYEREMYKCSQIYLTLFSKFSFHIFVVRAASSVVLKLQWSPATKCTSQKCENMLNNSKVWEQKCFQENELNVSVEFVVGLVLAILYDYWNCYEFVQQYSKYVFKVLHYNNNNVLYCCRCAFRCSLARFPLSLHFNQTKLIKV